jgi:hypothetical protein
MSSNNNSYHNKATCNIPTSNYTASAVLPWIYRYQMSQTTTNYRTTQMLSRI